ncbi:MAG: hypothetical protein ACK56I_16370, partial [bacterium]
MPAGMAGVGCPMRTDADADGRGLANAPLRPHDAGADSAEGGLRGRAARLAGGGILAAVLMAVAVGAGGLLRAALPETVTLGPVPRAAAVE